jgi:hypothetical protein
MENNSIMSKFNAYNDLNQEIIFLNAKYGWLLRLDDQEKERFKKLLSQNNLLDQLISNSIEIEKLNHT